MPTLNLRKQAAWLQLIIFGVITMVVAFLSTLVGAYILASTTHIPLSVLGGLKASDFARPEYAGLARGLLVVQFFGIFLLPSLIFAFLADAEPFRFCGLQRPERSRDLLIGAAVMLCAYFVVEWLVVLNQQLVQHLFGKAAQRWISEGESEVNATLQNILNMKNAGDLLLSIVLVGLMAAVGEELFFRGVLQRIFIQAFRNPWAGILVTAAIFSAVHGQFLGFIPRMILGAVLGGLYWYTGSLYVSVIGHFLFNSLQVLLVYFKVADAGGSHPGGTFQFFTGLVALFAVVTMLNYLRRHSNTTYARIYGNDRLPASPM